MQITREVIFVLHGPLLFKPVIFSTSFKTNLFIKTLIGEVEKRKKNYTGNNNILLCSN